MWSAKWLTTNFDSGQRSFNFWKGELSSEATLSAKCGCQAKIFSALQEHCPPEKNRSLIAIRCRYRLGRNLALLKNSPTKVGAHVFRHQLRVKTRSMNGFGYFINYELKSVG